MSKVRSKPPAKSRVIGRKAFAAISAVEGLKLGGESRARLQRLRQSGLAPEERRSAVLSTYRSRRPSK